MLSFALVYVLWGSTYLAMRVAVVQIPPYAVGSVRFLIAGPVMLAACALLRKNIRLNPRDLVRLATIGVLEIARIARSAKIAKN